MLCYVMLCYVLFFVWVFHNYIRRELGFVVHVCIFFAISNDLARVNAQMAIAHLEASSFTISFPKPAILLVSTKDH